MKPKEGRRSHNVTAELMKQKANMQGKIQLKNSLIIFKTDRINNYD